MTLTGVASLTGVSSITFTTGVIPPVYTTWNSANKYQITLSNSDLTATHIGGGGNGAVASILGVSSGKWYWEITATTINGVQSVGIFKAPDDVVQIPGQETSSYCYWSSGDFFTGAIGGPASWTSGSIIGIALDADAGSIQFFKNNVSQGTPYTGLSGTFYAICGGQDNSPNSVLTANFGASALTYTPPVGFNSGLYT